MTNNTLLFIVSNCLVQLCFVLCTGMLSLKVDLCVNLKFLVKLNKTLTLCFQMIAEGYGEGAIAHACVFE